jgi:hypothetical protein
MPITVTCNLSLFKSDTHLLGHFSVFVLSRLTRGECTLGLGTREAPCDYWYEKWGDAVWMPVGALESNQSLRHDLF